MTWISDTPGERIAKKSEPVPPTPASEVASIAMEPTATVTPVVQPVATQPPTPVPTPTLVPTATPTPLPKHIFPPTPVATQPPVPTQLPVATQLPGGSGGVVGMIQQIFGAYAPTAIRIATCESGLNPNAYNPAPIGGSHAAGLFQILYPSTWSGTSQASVSPYTASANIQAAHEIFVRDGYSWREWVCR